MSPLFKSFFVCFLGRRGSSYCDSTGENSVFSYFQKLKKIIILPVNYLLYVHPFFLFDASKFGVLEEASIISNWNLSSCLQLVYDIIWNYQSFGQYFLSCMSQRATLRTVCIGLQNTKLAGPYSQLHASQCFSPDNYNFFFL